VPRRAGLLFLWSAAIHRRFCFWASAKLPKAGNKSGDESPHSKGETQKIDGQENQETLI
jgi:hypothetical protein